MFVTKFNAVPSAPERNSGVCKTEVAGYVPAKIKIEQMIQAGRRLREFRENDFDFESEEDIEEDFEDPTRAKNFDMADMTEIGNSILARKREAKNLKTESEKESLNKKAESVEKPATE